ncbi:MAG: [Fe-Fe] hydrogenase large subunit C-terminal domain-containing protein, partial [Agathobaculum butyriciproducens]
FTSCCPGWVRFLKSQFPEMTGRLSTAKSPQQMFGAVGKTWLAHNLGVDADKIYSISIMPCIAKKAERELPSMDSAGHGSDVDLVITTRELARMARAEHLDVENIAESSFDSPLGDGTGAGVIFGATGGVMEAALRSAYFLTTGENPSPDAFREVRDDGTISPLPWREATFELAGRTVRCAVASGLGNARQLLHSLQRREVHYEFVEIMACPGGCAGGGGQPVDGTDREKAADRGKVLFRLDQNAPLRFSHENPAVQALYREYLDEPCSHRAEELLHCDHFAWQMNASR